VTKPVAQMWYVVDRDGRLWWGANDAETAALSLFSQGYTVVRVDPDGTWDYSAGTSGCSSFKDS
jgi:hypothetical protein